MYMGPSCSVEVSRNVQLLMLDHLYGHRMGANVSNSRRAAGSRERGLLTCWLALERASKAASSHPVPVTSFSGLEATSSSSFLALRLRARLDR